MAFTVRHVVVLGGGFGGLNTAQRVMELARGRVRVTLIDPRPYLLFVPHVAAEVLEGRDPAQTLRMPLAPVLEKDGIRFIQAEVTEIDLTAQRVAYRPTEAPGAALERIGFDHLVLAVGARLAYDRIEGFAEHGHAVSGPHYAHRLRRFLDDGYKGGPVAVGSARFRQGRRGKPQWLPIAEAACEGPVMELAMSLAGWLEEHGKGGGGVTLFTPARVIHEGAGVEIVKRLLEVVEARGLTYLNGTRDITRLTADGIVFANGTEIEAELKIVFPNWEPHGFMKGLPFADEEGFVVTDLTMRADGHPNVLAVGDCAALAVPKLASTAQRQAEIAARQIAKDVAALPAEQADKPFKAELVWVGEMGDRKGFYVHSDTWYGGKTEVLRTGHLPYALKMAHKEMFFRRGGKVPDWGVPFAEWTAEHL
jgi:sulfide:quinone oxidoreductase